MSIKENTASLQEILEIVNELPEAGGVQLPTLQATPTISVDSSTGLITASVTQSAGYVAAGTKEATMQLTTQAAQTITPGISNKTIASGRYLTGTQTIKGDSNLIAENIKKNVSIFDVIGNYEGTSCGQYCWKKYAVKKNYELTQESLGTTEPDDCGIASYPSYKITDDGYFQMNTGTAALDVFHLPIGATDGKTKYIYREVWNYAVSGSYYTYTKYTLSDTYTETKSDFLGYVVSDNSNMYPDDGTSVDGYWYVLVGDTD